MSSEYPNKDAMVIFTSVFCAVTIVANLFMMIAILASPKLRTSPKHLLIFFLCLADLYSGVFELPLLAEYWSLERWTHAQSVLNFLDRGGYYVSMSLRMSLVISICTISILSMLRCNKDILIMLSVSMIIASIGYSLVFVLPATEGPPHADPLSSCHSDIIATKRNVFIVGGFFSKAFVMVVLAVDIIIMHCKFSRSLAVDNSNNPRKFPVDVLSACVLMLVCHTPFTIFLAYFPSCWDSACRTWLIVRSVTLQWDFIRTCIMPFVWMLCRETRSSVKQVCCCRREPQSDQTGYTHEITQYQTPHEHQVIVSNM